MAIAAVKTSNVLGKSPLVKESQRFIAHAFFGTVLKQMHNSPWRSGLLSGGQAGRSFDALLDDRLADRMANNPAGNKLVRSIVRKLEKKTQRTESKSAGPALVVPSAANAAATTATADPVDAALASAAGHLGFLSQAPRIDLKG